MVEDRGVNSGELLQTSHPPEPLHCAFSPSERKVGILRAIVEPPTGFLPVCGADSTERGTVGSEPVGHDRVDPTMPFQRSSEKFQGRGLVAGLRHETLKHLALVIDGTPQVMPFTVDLHENLVQMPSPAA